LRMSENGWFLAPVTFKTMRPPRPGERPANHH
jgi:hypothetical protein